jgi:hypothetical protein
MKYAPGICFWHVLARLAKSAQKGWTVRVHDQTRFFFQAENLWFTRARFCVKIHSVGERYKKEERYKKVSEY